MEILKRNDVTVITMDDRFDDAVARTLKGMVQNMSEPVSYTHLTLPTKRIV